MTKENTIGIYHKNCTDGTTAAAVLLRKFPNITLFPLAHGYAPEEMDEIITTAGGDSIVYMVDIAAGAKELLENGNTVVVVDHHIGLKDEMEQLAKEYDTLTYVFNNDKSGGSFSWAYFFPEEDEPELIKYVEDSDLWTQKYDETKYVANYLSMYTNDPKKFLEFIESEEIEKIKENGKIISDYTDTQIDKMIENIQSVQLCIGPHTVPAYNMTNYQSAIGSKLSSLYNAATVMFTIKGDIVTFSFRSKDGQYPSALDLAELLGGGGHVKSAGAEISLSDFLKLIDQESIHKE